jgi:polyisoprenoid-binding protein YceI
MPLRTLTAVAALVLTTAAPADTLRFTNSGSTVEFTVIKKEVPQSGGFRKFAGTISLPGGDFAKARLTAEIRTDSLDAQNDRLNPLFRSPDVFDVDRYPTATLVSTGVRPVRGDSGVTHLLTADLTLHGVTKKVTIPVRVSRTEFGLTLSGKFTVQRKEFGMTSGEGQVKDDVTLRLMLRAGK